MSLRCDDAPSFRDEPARCMVKAGVTMIDFLEVAGLSLAGIVSVVAVASFVLFSIGANT